VPYLGSTLLERPLEQFASVRQAAPSATSCAKRPIPPLPPNPPILLKVPDAKRLEYPAAAVPQTTGAWSGKQLLLR